MTETPSFDDDDPEVYKNTGALDNENTRYTRIYCAPQNLQLFISYRFD